MADENRPRESAIGAYLRETAQYWATLYVLYLFGDGTAPQPIKCPFDICIRALERKREHIGAPSTPVEVDIDERIVVVNHRPFNLYFECTVGDLVVFELDEDACVNHVRARRPSDNV